MGEINYTKEWSQGQMAGTALSQPGRYSWDGHAPGRTGLCNQMNQLADVGMVSRASNANVGV